MCDEGVKMLLLSTPHRSWAGETPKELFSRIRLDYDIPNTIPVNIAEDDLIPAVMEVFGFSEDQCVLTEVAIEPPYEEVVIGLDAKPYVGWLELQPLYWDDEGVFQVTEVLDESRARAIPLFTKARLPEYFDEEVLTSARGADRVGFDEAISHFAQMGREASDAFLLRLREDVGDKPVVIELSDSSSAGLTTARSKTFITLTPEGYPFVYENIYMGRDVYSTTYPEALEWVYMSRRGPYPNASN